MRLPGARATVCRGFTALAAAALIGLAGSPPLHGTGPEIANSETRALWVLRSSLASPESIATLIRTARDHGFNTLLVQVRGRGDAYFNGGIEPRAAELGRQPAAFDPLSTVLASGHSAGLRVHAWVNVNLISSAADLPIAATHVVHRHPEWLMVPRDLAQELSRVKEESPGYVGKIARWTRSQTTIEGLYASPILPGAVDYVDGVVRDLVARYNVDGVHLDYARYPTDRFDYSRGAVREFRDSIRPSLSIEQRRDLDARESVDPLLYPDAFPDEWKAFRIARMTALVTRLRNTIKAARAGTVVTVATAPDVQEARDHRLQDWSAWLQNGLVDAVCPMAYTPEPARFAEQIAAARDAAGGRPIWAGIGAYRLPPAQTIENIETARRLGAAGVVLFSYDSLVDPQQSAPDYIAVVGRSAFAKPAAASDGTR
ncbi:MAG TPA: family 10 glycosylhydrolase [Vicinamibacterales bacterium]|jgi:uncharacterized lipoprotein YddW (UPF0748 family)